MFAIFAHVFQWLFSKAAQLIVLWLVVLVGVAVYLWSQKFLEQLPEELAKKERVIRGLSLEVSRLDERIGEIRAAVGRQIEVIEEKRQLLREELQKRERDIRDWQAQIERLRGAGARTRSFWDRLRGVETDGNKDEIEALDQRIAATQTQGNALREKVRTLDGEEAALTEAAAGEEAGIQAKREDTLADLTAAEAERTEIQAQADRWDSRFHRGQDLLMAAYHKMGRPLIWISLSIIFLPLVAKLGLYYGWAPLLSLGKPVVLRSAAGDSVHVSESAVAQEIVLEPGEVATIQHRFYQASDEDLRKRTKFVFSWRYPFSSLACGLFLLTRVTNGNAEARRRLTLSSQSEAEIEMAVVEIPEGGSLICRPSFVAALIQRDGEEPQIRSHWRFFSLHAWITLQFRYFEFRGPVKMVLWAYRGVRAEDMSRNTLGHGLGGERRTNQLATIGFTPSLNYRSRRSETLISYLRSQNPLFDDPIRYGFGRFGSCSIYV